MNSVIANSVITNSVTMNAMSAVILNNGSTDVSIEGVKLFNLELFVKTWCDCIFTTLHNIRSDSYETTQVSGDKFVIM